MTGPNARSVALDCLLLIAEEGQFSHVVLAAARDKFAWMAEEERALSSASCTAVLNTCRSWTA